MSRDIRQVMGDYLPRYYADSRIVCNLLDRESAEFVALNAAVQDVLAQFSVSTATWGLDRWERICNIPTDLSKPIEQRRSVVKSKLRGIGTVTVGLVKSVAEAYLNGEVDVAQDTANYTVTVTFVGKLGVPPNIDDIKNALREIIPAHLDINYEFTYLTWDELDAANMTRDQTDALNLTWDQWDVWKP